MNASDECAVEPSTEVNAGWADSIAKVLNTTKLRTKKTLVLSRAKKNKKCPKLSADNNEFGFEIDGDPIKEESSNEVLDSQVKQRNLKLALRVKPTWKDLEREKLLRKVATKGVVQLFNAVRQQQKNLHQELEKAGPLDSRREAVLNNINKRKFLDVLMSGNRAKSIAIDNPVKSEHLKESESTDDDEGNKKSRKKSEWSVLQEDFMANKKAKHWDEEDSDEKSESEGCDNNSDSEELD